MLAVKIKGFDIKEGKEFKYFFIVDPSSSRQLASEHVDINEDDPDINELRFKTGIKDIYAILDFGSWNNYWDNRHQLIELDKELANDPAVLKSIAEYEKDQKQFRIWQAAQKWSLN